MRHLRPASEDEVILEFLRAEISSSRFAGALFEALAAESAHRSLIDQADLEDEEQNAVRRRVLVRARYWMTEEDLFVGFPRSLSWSLVALDRADLDRVLFINHDDWLDVSGGTRLAVDAARRIAARDTWYARLWDTIPAHEIATDPALPRLIMVGDADGTKLVLLEGHLRFTAFFVAGAVPDRLEVFLGTADDLERWPLY